MPGRPLRPPPVAPLPTLVLALLLTLGAAGCSDGPSDGGSSGPSPSPAPPATTAEAPAAEPRVPTRRRVGSVTGRIPKAQRKLVVKRVARVVDKWLQAAYVGGEYPRSSFGRSYRGFTQGATRQARGDKELMTNVDIGDRIDGVTVKRREITVDVLAVGGTAHAATARVLLAFKTSGVERRVRVSGRLFLTKKAGRWRIFGYDVAKART
jgi:hypothetical protein